MGLILPHRAVLTLRAAGIRNSTQLANAYEAGKLARWPSRPRTACNVRNAGATARRPQTCRSAANRLLTTAGRMARKLLRDRGWDTVWCDVDQEQVWRKTFSPEDTQHLDEWDAFYYEQDHTRQFFRDGGIPVSPRKPKP